MALWVARVLVAQTPRHESVGVDGDIWQVAEFGRTCPKNSGDSE
jgi:hypothetical protein